ncbi:SAV_915 family protein [Nocardioides mangrovi]|uniref:SseB protein N-terminal domain-containing protein n=1 Tax=Nocardioides mangrovi TaxID=2874580 RepID=A0ABS7UBQ2_9ACTN|nr:SAV_915 family protein [Nocardioides mangrovi]MBZ5738300.1 hypothetical protein [Nocardioides mangrovi]
MAAAATVPDRRDPAHYPPILYLPCTRQTPHPEELEVRYQRTEDGRQALLVYSALDRLQTCCGVDQPWFTFPTAELPRLHQNAPFDLVLMDLYVPEESRAGLRA